MFITSEDYVHGKLLSRVLVKREGTREYVMMPASSCFALLFAAPLRNILLLSPTKSDAALVDHFQHDYKLDWPE